MDKVGPESIEALQVGTFPAPFGTIFQSVFVTRYGQDFVFELLQKDCLEHIADTPFVTNHEGELRVNMTSDKHCLFCFLYHTVGFNRKQ